MQIEEVRGGFLCKNSFPTTIDLKGYYFNNFFDTKLDETFIKSSFGIKCQATRF